MKLTNHQIAEKIRGTGLKPTTQRIAILKELMSRTDHPGADLIYKNLKEDYPSLSMNTIYLNLETFVKYGIIQKINNLTNLGRFDGNAAPHHHFICVKCKKIIDLHDVMLPEIKIPEGFKIATVFTDQIQLNGVCIDCI